MPENIAAGASAFRDFSVEKQAGVGRKAIGKTIAE